MKLILIGTGNIALEVIKKILQDNRIQFLGTILDESVSEPVNQYYVGEIQKMGVKALSYSEEVFASADIIFACEYRKAIPQKYVDKYIFLNCHAGILPKYRGFSANAWAIMNGEKEIGYTIHRMDDKFDNGDIYYCGRFPIAKEQTYADLYETIFGDMIKSICDILLQVYDGTLAPIKQNTSGVYCSRFNAEMGNLEQFDETSEYIYNLYRSMAKPHGTGVFCALNGKKYYVGKIVLGQSIGMEDYRGIPGKIVNIEQDYLWVKTSDNIVLLSELVSEDGTPIGVDNFKIGNRFGK